MKRRDFLKFSVITGASAGLSFVPATRLYAAHDGYTGPLYLTIDARGGWDSTSLCDPKGYAPGQSSGRTNNYPSSSIRQVGNIRYAPPPDSFLGDTTLYSAQTFFEAYYQKLLVVNGIDTGTNSHTDGRRVSWSGELGKIGYPHIAALIAGTLAAGRSMPFITNGGYAGAADLLVPVRMDYRGINTLFEIAYPTRSDPQSASSRDYFSQQVTDLIKISSSSRQQALLNSQNLPRIRSSLLKLISTRQSEGHLKEMAINLANISEKPSSFFNGRARAQDIYRQGRIAMAGYQTGATASAHLSLNGFDTHQDHDNRHYPILMDFLQGIDAILQEAIERGISDRIVLIIGSDFGRTNNYNSDKGKDHWPISSMMFIGNSREVIQGNRVIGATTIDSNAIRIDRNTFSLDSNNTNPNSVNLTPAHIHRELRVLAGVQQTSAALNFDLGGEYLGIFS